ncbi:MAG TPA: oligoendopeptidase F [Ignavibacteriaceae bacterium]|nr:oligoendopeptidase F [Ignavibacteriaceae bacterium]
MRLKPNKLFFHKDEVMSLPVREEIEAKYKWNLQDIYLTDDDWESDFRWVESQIPNYKKFEGQLSKSVQNLLACLNFDNEIGIKLERLHLYAMLAKDSDMRVTKYQAADDRIRTLYSKANTASSFIRPELISIPDNQLLEMINNLNELKIYSHYIEELLRTKKHTLDKHSEEILSLASDALQTPYNTYSLFTNADIEFPSVEDESGSKVQMTHGRFYSAMYSKDQTYRERAFKAYLKPYKDFMNTFTSLFNGNLKTNIFNAKVRNYSSAKEASLDRNNIPVFVYDNLINAVGENLEPLHRWAKLKTKLLGVKNLHPYDVYVTIFPESSEKEYDFEEAKQLVLEALKPMGENYLSSLKMAFDNRWIDVYETKGKRSGGYSSGTTFGVHPYVLLNWTNLLNDVFTLAHEMGHNMHSYYTGLNQPFIYSNYSIFLAEVASTFNESLLLDYLIENAKNKQEKLFLIEKYLNNITATFYRQVMFAEFESIVYESAEKGEALTSDSLCKLYKDIYQKYWGPAMIVDKEEEYTWARIPHFYYNFYVFQYATGMAASEVLAAKVKKEGSQAVKNYQEFLKAGSSDYSINILKRAGVDMNSKDPVLAVTKKMTQLLNEIEELI